MSNSQQELQSPTPTLVDPDFSFTAIRAADELQQHLSGEKPTFDATHRLGDMLKRSIRSAVMMGEGGEPKSLNLITPTMAGVYNQAFHAIPYEGAGLREKTRGISTALSSADAGMKSTQSAQLRDFCIALAQNALGTVDLHARY